MAILVDTTSLFQLAPYNLIKTAFFDKSVSGDNVLIALKMKQIQDIDIITICSRITLEQEFELSYYMDWYGPAYRILSQEIETEDMSPEILAWAKLYPSKPIDEFFNVPISLDGAVLPTTIDLAETYAVNYSAVASDFVTTYVPPTLTTTSKIKVKAQSRTGVLSCFVNNIEKASGQWHQATYSVDFWLHTGQAAHFRSTASHNNISAIWYRRQNAQSPYAIYIAYGSNKPVFSSRGLA